MKMEPSTSRRSSRRNSFSSRSTSSSDSRLNNKDSKNPYSSSGLDKFSALLSELESKKQKIYSQVKNPDEISLVRFVYRDSDDCLPIVVKIKKNNDKQQEQQQQQQENINIKQSPSPRNEDLDKSPSESSNNSDQVKKQVNQSDNNKSKRSWRCSFSWNDFMKLTNNFRRPCYYLPAAIVLILLFLVFFGRSIAILCTSIGWYIVPTLESNPNPTVITRSTKKKREYVRTYSENKMLPKTATKNQSGNLNKHGHQKSWESS